MGKYISGILTCEIHFDNVYVEDGKDEIDLLLPDGWEGEMVDYNINIREEYEEI